MTTKLKVVTKERVFRLRDVAPASPVPIHPNTRAIFRSMPNRIAEIKREREAAAAATGRFVADYKKRHPEARIVICPKGGVYLSTDPEEE